MPTLKNKSTGKRVFFAHIPRTAGRYVEANLLYENNFQWDDDWESLGMVENIYYPHEGIELAHFHREYYEQYLDVEGIPHFSIVRNPINRFIGASIYIKRMYGDDCQELMEDPMLFFSMLENFPLTEAANWYRPQVDFIRSDTQVWKFENGFGEDFVSWLSGIVGVDLEFNEDVKYPIASDEGNKLEKTPKLIHNLKQLYRKDIEQFYPELAA